MTNSVVQFDVIDNGLQRLFADGQRVALLLDTLEGEASNALAQAQRAVINSEDKLGAAGELSKAITGRLKTLEEERKAFTVPLDEAKARIMEAFKPAKETFESAKDLLKVKSSEFLRKEQARRAAEAAAEQARIREEARKAAEEKASEGDLEAATGVLETAAEVAAKAQPQKVLGVGGFGTKSSGQRVISGEVSNLKEFIKFLASPEGALLSDIIGLGTIIEAKKAGLNKLAKVAVDRKVEIPGLAVSDVEEARFR